MNTLCLNSNYNTFSLNQLECLYDGFDSSSNGLDYYGNDNALEDQLTKELDDLLQSCKKSSITTTFTPIMTLATTSTDEEIYAVNADLQRRHKNSVKQLETAERNRLCDLGQYNRLTMKNASIKVKACIDFMDIKFTATKAHTRSIIKKYLTEKTGIKHFIKTIDESDNILGDEESNNLNDRIGTTFVIRLHDANNIEALYERLSFLKHYNASLNIADLEIVRVERAIDFYGASQEMRIALNKAVRLKQANNCRYYSNNVLPFEKNKMFSIFDEHHEVIDGNTIYINNRDSDHYLRFYFKTTDVNGQPLTVEEHRVRFEENYSGNALLHLNYGQAVRIRDLAKVIRNMSSALSFTKLRDDALSYFKSGFRDFVKPYGLEKEFIVGLNNRKIKRRVNGKARTLCQYLEPHAEFNQKVRETQMELAERFKIKD